MRRLAVTLTALAAIALVPATAGAGATRSVSVRDGYFSPSKMTVRTGTTVRWVWANGLSDTHDVMLDKHPKGVAPFMSDYAAGSYTFKRTLKKPGTYTFLCDLHQGMKMTIVVKR